MRRCILIAGIFAVNLGSFAQITRYLPFEEIRTSANMTLIGDEDSDNGFGFGIGAYHSYRSEKTVNILFGFEYNRTSQYHDYISEGHFSVVNDVTLISQSFSPYVGPRVNIGKRIKFFFDAGFYLDYLGKSQMTGERTYCYAEGEQLICNIHEINERIPFTGGIGFQPGAGLRIPLSAVELIVSTDYKYGIGSLNRGNSYSRFIRLMLGVRII